MMRFAGIDVGSERHMVAMVEEQGEVLCRSSPFSEDASGYAELLELLGPPEGCLLALEATGHYWRNLFVALLGKGYAVAVLNPLRTRRFAEEELQRTKTDAIDALGIADLLPRSDRWQRNCLTSQQKSCANCHDCATGFRRILRAVRGSYIERLTWAFQSSPGMCTRSRASSPPPFCRATQLPRLLMALR
jgi:hypothetical protein